MRIFLIVSLLLLSACSGGEQTEQANAAIERFHADLNRGDFGQIYARTDPEWKQSSPEKASTQLFSGIRRKLGQFKSSKQIGWKVNYGTNGTLVVVQHESVFEKGPAQETFTYRITQGNPRLLGYNINSNALIAE